MQFHKVVFEENENSPSRKVAAGNSEPAVPTPIRRIRRAGQSAISPLVLSEKKPESEPSQTKDETLREENDISFSRDTQSDQSREAKPIATQTDIAARYHSIDQSFEKIRRDLVRIC